jgi:hypothetical protein
VNGTVLPLQERLYRHSGRCLADDTIRRELDGLGYVCKRFRYVLRPDPERENQTRHPTAVAGSATTQRQVG